MKIYYLHLTNSDFVFNGITWLSNVIDLYENNSYINYSAVKSDYGLNSLGNRTWTGMSASPDYITDSGRIDNGRFIDHSGRIDLMMQDLIVSDASGVGGIQAKVNVYTSNGPEDLFPNLWAQKRDIDSQDNIIWVDAYRYVRFEITFSTSADISNINLEYDVRVEIDRPVMAPLYRRTKIIMDKFPQWMALRADSIDSATPQLATPTSVGGQLINAVAGEWLTLIDRDLEYVRLQSYIATADLNEVAWVYFTAGVPDRVFSVQGDGVQLTNTSTLGDFYEADLSDNVYYWDELKQNIYIRSNYNVLWINNIQYTTDLQQIWNWFDEHGSIVDLVRLVGESNASFQKRILDVYINQPGVTVEKFKLALRRELDLWKSFASTPSTSLPDSYAMGATPIVLEMQDIENSLEYVDPDGVPTDKFITLVNEMAERFPTTWGYFKWDQAVWDTAGVNNKGFGILPYRYDATPPTSIQAGIGDGSDLFVYRPDDITGPREFNYRLKIRGRQRSHRTEYPTITIKADIYGVASKKLYNNPRQKPYFTFVAVTASKTYYLPILASVISDVDTDKPTPTANSYYIYDILGPDGKTKLDQTWYDNLGNTYSGNVATPFYLDLSTVTSSYLQWGRYEPLTHTFTDYPTTNSVTTWFADSSGASPNTLAANSSNTHLIPSNQHIPGSVVIVSNITSFTIGDWESNHQPYEIKINGVLPRQTQQSTTIALPTIVWDPNLESVPNKRYIIKITEHDNNGNPTLRTVSGNAGIVFLPITMLSVSGNNTWSVDKLTFTFGSVTQFTFTSNTSVSPQYPFQESVWQLFEANELVQRYGVVDENGPWRNGIPQEPGGFNFLIEQANVSRASFGLSNNIDYVVTWIGVEVIANNRVMAWLDTNTVHPATDDINSLLYLDNVVKESYDNSISNYVFSPFFIRARMRPEIDPQWNPQVHSGWFYQDEEEYYLYANAITESTPGHQFALGQVARQGAPIILETNQATPSEYRQVVFFDEATPQLSLTNKEIVNGSGTSILYVAYKDIFDISVIDLSNNLSVTAATYSDSNAVTTGIITDKDSTYQVQYKVNKSFTADHEFTNTDHTNRTNIQIAERIPYNGNYNTTYEGSNYDPATPIFLPLNTFYTIMDEGFIFLSYDEYDFKYVEVKLSPSKVLADGEDYMLASIFSYDEHGNPKPNQSFDLYTSFGVFETTNTNIKTIKTNDDGFATTIITSNNTTTTLNGYIKVDGPGLADATVNYEIASIEKKRPRLVALPSSEAIPADGHSQVVVYGKVEDENFKPIPYAAVTWKRDRTMPELFMKGYQGQVIADDQGKFTIPALTAATPYSPGYWFMQLESWHQGSSPSRVVINPNYAATPYIFPQYGPIGDVVFWNEYPDAKFGTNNKITQVPIPPVQNHVNPIETVYYITDPVVAFPVTYNPATPVYHATPVVPIYTPPNWYACDRYTQYQLGLLGHLFYVVVKALIDASRPFWKDL